MIATALLILSLSAGFATQEATNSVLKTDRTQSLQERGWALVWSDEFDGTALDRSKWEVEESCWGGGNNERQCYIDQPSTVRVINGQLWLRAYQRRFTGVKYPKSWPRGRGGQVTQDYVSGKVQTRERSSWTYGRFEARIKLPKGQGTWPAFWMLPADNAYGGWAASGEIDIMEAVNLGASCPLCAGNEGENRSSGALHFGGEWPHNTHHAQFTPLPGAPGAAERFHIYAIEWAEGRIDWFVDDVRFYSLKADDWFTTKTEKDENPFAPFDKDFFLILNLAVGGKLSETNNAQGFDHNSFPADMFIDWVRVYTCKDDKPSGLACMDPRSD